MEHNLLLVDDEPLSLAMSREFLEKRGFKVDTAVSGWEAVATLKKQPSKYSVVIVDYQMEGLDGTETTEALLKVNPTLSIVIYSSDPKLEAFLLPHRSGARSYVSKLEEADVLLRTLRRLCKEHEEKHQGLSASESSDNAELIASVRMIGRSAPLARIAGVVLKLQKKDGPVLILGESGVGKELVAQALHNDRSGPFKAVNCADYLLNPETARSALFGHVRGAYTGAVGDKRGLFEEAGSGTVFLDEIDTLPLEAQVGLLRALEARVVMPLGSNKEVPVRCRIIASAKPDLATRLGDGSFKPDLFYRINENIISVPALSQRRDDLVPLVKHFAHLWAERNGEAKEFLASTLPYFERYSWPGNVRELRNVVFSILNLTEKTKVGPGELHEHFPEFFSTHTAFESDIASLKSRLDSTRKEQLVEALEKSRSYREAARQLSVAPSTVLKLIAKLGIDGESVLGSKREKAKARAR